MKPNNCCMKPRKSALPPAVVAKMDKVGQRKAISMVGMAKDGQK